MKITRVGLDIANRYFRCTGSMNMTKLVCVNSWRGRRYWSFFAQLPPCLIGIEACASAHSNEQLQQIAAERADCKLLTSIPGVGPMVATTLVAAVGDPRQFKNGRQFAAWAGLTPRQR